MRLPSNSTVPCSSLLAPFLGIAVGLATSLQGFPQQVDVPTLEEVTKSKLDLWGELAIKQKDGPKFEFFESLLPPPRYVHADFRDYPLVLSAPRSPTKARLISNGSGINLRGGSRSWKDVGTPIRFRVGPDEFQFGGLIDRLSTPRLVEGWLPIYEIDYRHPFPVQSEGLVPIDQKPAHREAELYRMEAFVTTNPEFESYGVVFVRFSLAAGTQGIITVQRDPTTETRPVEGEWLDEQGKVIALFDRNWTWERKGMHAKLTRDHSVFLAIPTQAIDKKLLRIDRSVYERHRNETIACWKKIVRKGMSIRVDEERINHAWKNLLVQNYMIVQGSQLHYSSGNQYQQLYVAEGGDAARAFLTWGHEEEAKELVVPILDYIRKGLEHHQAGLKLMDLEYFWWMTRDREWLQSQRLRWTRELNRLMSHRSDPEFLLPKERYCGDISTPIHSLSVEAKGWRALHDWSHLLKGIDEEELAEKVEAYARELQPKLLQAVNLSLRRETDPPFIPIALLDREEPHSPITATRIGSYWNLISNFVIGSRLFPTGSMEEQWLPNYIENHGGLCMGMTRAGGTAHGFWTGSERTNPLYGTRYVLDALRRDDPDRALVSFYGMLAHGFTRNTFVAGEGCTLQPVDAYGRFFYCPPNTAGNAHFLTMLRNLLVQDWDLDGDGEPETLRLLYAGSKGWLTDGKVIDIDRAPTAFGSLAFRVESHLSRNEISLSIDLPRRSRPKKILVRPRPPEGWKIVRATLENRDLQPDGDGAFDLSHKQGQVAMIFHCIPSDR